MSLLDWNYQNSSALAALLHLEVDTREALSAAQGRETFFHLDGHQQFWSAKAAGIRQAYGILKKKPIPMSSSKTSSFVIVALNVSRLSWNPIRPAKVRPCRAKQSIFLATSSPNRTGGRSEALPPIYSYIATACLLIGLTLKGSVPPTPPPCRRLPT